MTIQQICDELNRLGVRPWGMGPGTDLFHPNIKGTIHFNHADRVWEVIES